MAFQITYSAEGVSEPCDKCNVRDTAPMLSLSFRLRQYPNAVIFIHERCLMKGVDAAKKKAQKGGAR